MKEQAKYHVFENGERISEWENFDDAMEDMKNYAEEVIMCIRKTDGFQYYKYMIMEMIGGKGNVLEELTITFEKI